MRLLLQTLSILIVVTLVGGSGVVLLNKDIPDYPVPDAPWEAGTALDGQTFFTTDTILETQDEVLDSFRFRDGKFQSSMCQVYCDFGWSDYQTFVADGVLHFTATTSCPDAPHKVVFYGTVIDGTLSFEGTWTTRRWYWTQQLNAVGSGTETPTEAHIAAGITS